MPQKGEHGQQLGTQLKGQERQELKSPLDLSDHNKIYLMEAG